MWNALIATSTTPSEFNIYNIYPVGLKIYIGITLNSKVFLDVHLNYKNLYKPHIHVKCSNMLLCCVFSHFSSYLIFSKSYFWLWYKKIRVFYEKLLNGDVYFYILYCGDVVSCKQLLIHEKNSVGINVSIFFTLFLLNNISFYVWILIGIFSVLFVAWFFCFVFFFF